MKIKTILASFIIAAALSLGAVAPLASAATIVRKSSVATSKHRRTRKPPVSRTRRARPRVGQSHEGATAECNDGTLSYSANHRGTCSHHGGVKRWFK
jgi:hypothetical protein